MKSYQKFINILYIMITNKLNLLKIGNIEKNSKKSIKIKKYFNKII